MGSRRCINSAVYRVEALSVSQVVRDMAEYGSSANDCRSSLILRMNRLVSKVAWKGWNFLCTNLGISKVSLLKSVIVIPMREKY
jgi:hypothetical protein